MLDYFTRIREYLSNREILPIIIRDKGRYSLDEIVEGMKQVPYEEIKDKLPIEFARTVRLIFE